MKAIAGRPLVFAGVVIALLGLGWTAATVLGTDSSRPAGVAKALDPAVAAESTARADRLSRLQAQVADNPDDWEAFALLDVALVDRSRVDADATRYPSAERSLARSLELRPDNVPALIGMSALAAARHDFDEALDWGNQALAVAPDDPDAHAVVGDALLELGRYDESFVSFQRMVDLRPDAAAYARVSYARELQGDIDGAVAAMAAAETASSRSTDSAFAAYHLGELEWHRGKADDARSHYERALRADPSFIPPQAALARMAFFDGEIDKAIRQYESIIDRAPLPQYLGELADLFSATGQPARAEVPLDLLAVQRRLLEANGVNTDLDLAVIEADHGVSREEDLAAIRSEWERRPSVFADDTLAWLLHAAGRDAEALVHADRALRLGTRNALFLFHRGLIHDALGNHDAARRDLAEALAINPRFSMLHARTAADLIGPR